MSPVQKLRALLESKGIYKEAITLMKEHKTGLTKSGKPWFYVEAGEDDFEDLGVFSRRHENWDVCNKLLGPIDRFDSRREAEQYCDDLNSGKKKIPGWVSKAIDDDSGK